MVFFLFEILLDFLIKFFFLQRTLFSSLFEISYFVKFWRTQINFDHDQKGWNGIHFRSKKWEFNTFKSLWTNILTTAWRKTDEWGKGGKFFFCRRKQRYTKTREYLQKLLSKYEPFKKVKTLRNWKSFVPFHANLSECWRKKSPKTKISIWKQLSSQTRLNLSKMWTSEILPSKEGDGNVIHLKGCS